MLRPRVVGFPAGRGCDSALLPAARAAAPAARAAVTRQALHARTLGFAHPTAPHARLHFDAPRPADLEGAIAMLRASERGGGAGRGGEEGAG